MNEIMISIKPEWCRKIMTGQKTAEVRRTKPKLNTPFKCLIYCTKDVKSNELYKGKVVAEFICDKIFDIDTGNRAEIIENSCLTEEQLKAYGGRYAWHISHLKKYEPVLPLETYLKKAPQSWCYIKM